MIKPFRFSNLKKVSKKEQSLIEGAYSLFPADVRGAIEVEIRKVLMRHLGEKAFYYADSIETFAFAPYLESISENRVLALISIEPFPAKIILQIDKNLSFALIDKLLGGIGAPAVEARPLTETEKGVIQYLIMQILATIWVACGKKANTHFRFERFVQSPLELKKIMNDKDIVVSAGFKVGIGELAGFVQLGLPKSFIDKAGLASKEIDNEYFMKRADSFDYLRTTLWAEAGRVSVLARDVETLEEGDVIVFDDTGLSLEGEKVKGKAMLRVGKGESAGLTAKVDSSADKVKCTITGS